MAVALCAQLLEAATCRPVGTGGRGGWGAEVAAVPNNNFLIIHKGMATDAPGPPVFDPTLAAEQYEFHSNRH